MAEQSRPQQLPRREHYVPRNLTGVAQIARDDDRFHLGRSNAATALAGSEHLLTQRVE